MIATVLQVAGVVMVVGATAVLSPYVAVIVAGLIVLTVGVGLERRD